MSLLPRHHEVRLIGRSEAIRSLEAELDAAARSDAKVLITGETGVGKEVVARLIHQRSQRTAASLVTLNCAGLPDSLLESELFGHVRGSFTGAYRDKPGLVEMASNGTLFLDEVGEMSMRMQVVLLRFLETGEIQRIGSDRAHTRVNVRLITATNRDLESQIQTGAFREDLFFRLNVVRLNIPPLRERLEDIPLLVNYYVNFYSQLHKVPTAEVEADAHRRARRLSVAGKRPGAQERRRAHCAPDERAYDRARRPAARHPALRGDSPIVQRGGARHFHRGDDTRGGPGRAHAQAGRVVLGGGLSAIHVS